MLDIEYYVIKSDVIRVLTVRQGNTTYQLLQEVYLIIRTKGCQIIGRQNHDPGDDRFTASRHNCLRFWIAPLAETLGSQCVMIVHQLFLIYNST